MTTHRRVPARTAGAAAALLLASSLGQVCGATAAGAATHAFSWNDASYILTIRSGAVETYALIPRDLPQDIGYSYVDLSHDTGAPVGRCEAESAAYWMGLEIEEGVLSYGASPPGADGKATTGYQNPTHAHTVSPDLTPGHDATTAPTITSPTGPMWSAQCDNDAKGAAAGNVAGWNGIGLLGSTTSGTVDKDTGVYVGTSRAYMQGITGAGNINAITSFMQVKNKPNVEPAITYRMSFFESDAGASASSLSQNGFTLSGTDVPVSQFVNQFNDQAKSGAAALAALGPAGLQLLAPTVGTSTDGDRYAITAPTVAGHFGLAARQGTVGQDQGIRFGSVTFSGVYGNN